MQTDLPHVYELVLHGRVEVDGGTTQYRVNSLFYNTDKDPTFIVDNIRSARGLWLRWRHYMQKPVAVCRSHIWSRRESLYACNTDINHRNNELAISMIHMMYTVGIEHDHHLKDNTSRLSVVGEVYRNESAIHNKYVWFPVEIPRFAWWRDCGKEPRDVEHHNNLTRWVMKKEQKSHNSTGKNRVLAQTNRDYGDFLKRGRMDIKRRHTLAEFWQRCIWSVIMLLTLVYILEEITSLIEYIYIIHSDISSRVAFRISVACAIIPWEIPPIEYVSYRNNIAPPWSKQKLAEAHKQGLNLIIHSTNMISRRKHLGTLYILLWYMIESVLIGCLLYYAIIGIWTDSVSQPLLAGVQQCLWLVPT
jgi:hypothetical protein